MSDSPSFVGNAHRLSGQVKNSDSESREHEEKLFAKRIMKLPSNQQLRVEYSGANPIYVGTAPRSLAEGTDGWMIQKITYSGDNPTTIQIAYSNWTNRVSATYA